MSTFKNHAKNTLIAGALLLSQTMYLTPLPVLADSSVRLAGQTMFTIPATGGTSADHRAETVQNNLDNALVATKDRSPSSINITYVKGLPVITLGGYQVVTVDSATAKAANSTPAVLAGKWAGALRESLADQASVSSYVSQLTGSFASSAPPVAAAPPQAPMPQSQDEYNSVGARPANYQGSVGYQNFNGPGSAQYGGGGGYPPQGQYNGGIGGGGYPPQGQYNGGIGGGGYQQRGRVAYAPAGLTMPISLQTSISTQVAKPGDLIQAQISQTMYLGDATIPQGSILTGTITDAEAGRRLSRSGELSIKFNRLRTPDGIETPITAHLVGGIGKYTDKGSDQSDTVRGEGWKAKVGQTAIRGGVGAGAGAALGTAIGAIAGRSGTGAGRGAWSGAAIGGGVGAASMLMRKGRDVIIPSGTQMQLQLDAPATIAGGGMGGPGGQLATPYGGGMQ
ncbi:MAG: hypothetical protein U0103_09475 [Candidatus Obscuribacterales bacterium]|nr:MAG: hypothetical protein EKK48_26520 [Candidatus Melainabacteria bacterium]